MAIIKSDNVAFPSTTFVNKGSLKESVAVKNTTLAAADVLQLLRVPAHIRVSELVKTSNVATITVLSAEPDTAGNYRTLGTYAISTAPSVKRLYEEITWASGVTAPTEEPRDEYILAFVATAAVTTAADFGLKIRYIDGN